MKTTIMLGATSAISCRLVTPWDGAWFAELDLDPDLPTLPSGRQMLRIGTRALVGTVDPRATGIFAGTARARLVAGGGGWDKHVRAQHYHNDAGVTSATVLAATAAEVGESVVEAVPRRLGVDYVRSAGPASRVLADLDWHVDSAGVTLVSPRAPLPVDPTAIELLTWDAGAQRAELAADDLVLPGMVIVDTRVGTATVRDVEQTWNADGARAIAFCGSSTVSRLAGAMRRMAQEAVGLPHLKAHRCRVVSQGVDGRLVLQLVAGLASEMPPSAQIKVMPGLAGLSAKYKPGTEVVLEFLGGDPADPIVRSFAEVAPLEMTLDAARVIVGPMAASIDIGPIPQPLALAAPTLASLASVAAAFVVINATIPLMVAGYVSLTGPQQTAFTTAMGVVSAALGIAAPLAIPSKIVRAT